MDTHNNQTLSPALQVALAQNLVQEALDSTPRTEGQQSTTERVAQVAQPSIQQQAQEIREENNTRDMLKLAAKIGLYALAVAGAVAALVISLGFFSAAISAAAALPLATQLAIGTGGLLACVVGCYAAYRLFPVERPTQEQTDIEPPLVRVPVSPPAPNGSDQTTTTTITTSTTTESEPLATQPVNQAANQSEGVELPAINPANSIPVDEP